MAGIKNIKVLGDVPNSIQPDILAKVNEFYDKSSKEGREYGGLIYNNLSHEEYAGDKNTGELKMPINPLNPKWGDVMAQVHTHPVMSGYNVDASGDPSPDDLAASQSVYLKYQSPVFYSVGDKHITAFRDGKILGRYDRNTGKLLEGNQ